MPTPSNSDNNRRKTNASDPAAPNKRNPEPAPAQVVVEKLTTITLNRAGQALYLGWGPDGNAAITTSRQELSQAGQDIVRVYERARNLKVPVVPFLELVPVQYSYLKLKDLASPAEDYFLVNVLDSKGQGQQYSIGELELLEGIVNAQNFFQDTSQSSAMGQRIIPTEALYAIIAPCFQLDEKRTALAVLFKPAVEGSPQEITFQAFVISVLRFLWQNDKKDISDQRKGYYDAVQNNLATPTSQVPILLKMMFTSEDTAREKWESLKHWLYKQPETPTGGEADNLSQLDMPQLFALATMMRDAARAYFEGRAGKNTNFRWR